MCVAVGHPSLKSQAPSRTSAVRVGVRSGRSSEKPRSQRVNLSDSDLVSPIGSVMVKSPLNRELVATYEVTLSVIDNASDLPERSVSVPNGKTP